MALAIEGLLEDRVTAEYVGLLGAEVFLLLFDLALDLLGVDARRQRRELEGLGFDEVLAPGLEAGLGFSEDASEVAAVESFELTSSVEERPGDESRPVMIFRHQPGVRGIQASVADAACERFVIEDLFGGESSREHRAGAFPEHVDLAGKISDEILEDAERSPPRSCTCL
ncbi:MAG: hypothetical protein HY791_29420 [Deltaproteobacteria bacterium]|nr:hypothetical protein [Deltaproteobacteria bacterium]